MLRMHGQMTCMEFAFFIDSNDTVQFFLVASAAARIRTFQKSSYV